MKTLGVILTLDISMLVYDTYFTGVAITNRDMVQVWYFGILAMVMLVVTLVITRVIIEKGSRW